MVSRTGNSQTHGRDEILAHVFGLGKTPTLADARSFSLKAARHYHDVLDAWFRGRVSPGAVGVARGEWQRWESLVVDLRQAERQRLEGMVRK